MSDAADENGVFPFVCHGKTRRICQLGHRDIRHRLLARRNLNGDTLVTEALAFVSAHICLANSGGSSKQLPLHLVSLRISPSPKAEQLPAPSTACRTNLHLASSNRPGRTGRPRMGLAHIVESRTAKDGATLDEAIDVAIKVASAAESGKVTTERYNTKHLDEDGVRAIVAFMPDGSRVITGYEISADGLGGANRRSPNPKSPPHVSLEEIVSAPKDKLSSSAEIVPQKGTAAQGGGNKHPYPGKSGINYPRYSPEPIKPRGNKFP